MTDRSLNQPHVSLNPTVLLAKHRDDVNAVLIYKQHAISDQGSTQYGRRY